MACYPEWEKKKKKKKKKKKISTGHCTQISEMHNRKSKEVVKTSIDLQAPCARIYADFKPFLNAHDAR